MAEPRTAPGDGATSLEGTIERIAYANEQTAWSVVKLAVAGQAQPVTAVGKLLGVQPGESLRLSGRWVVDRRYGSQFQVERYVPVTPDTLVGIVRYLASGLVRGVGEVMAERLVRCFGLETLRVIDEHPERLLEVPGIGPVRRRRIQTAWAEQRAVKEVMIFLQTVGVATGHAVRIYKTYRDAAVAVVREDPYRLVLDVPGLGFKSADRIAMRVGLAPTASRRVQAGVLYVLDEIVDQGHVYAPRSRLVERSAALLDVEAPLVEAAVDALAAGLHVVLDPSSPAAEGAGVAAPVAAGAAVDGAPEVAVYPRRLYDAEVGAAERLAALRRAPLPALPLDVERAVAMLATKHTPALASVQLEAVRRTLTHKVTVLTGGPGTGKTTLVNGVLSALERARARVLLCAPTGRAAKRLAAATGRDAKTIHRALEFSPRAGAFERDRHRPLEVDFVVVDEVSMVDLVLFCHLLNALPPSCQLLLVGDVDQLPSVGPGSVLREVIASEVVEVARLTEIFRQAAASRIVVNAHRVNRGASLLLEDGDTASDFFFIERPEPEAVLRTMKSLIAERIPTRFGLHPVDDVQVLTPMHKGLLGSASLNAELQALLNPHGKGLTRGSQTLRVGDKVMQLRNDYDHDVFNGDLGRVTGVDDEDGALIVRFDDREIRYDGGDLGDVTLAYACSIHKAQGSEYPCVVMPVHTQHYVMLRRNLLYTGITRGRRLVVVVGSARALAIAIANAGADDRCTRLAARLRAAAGRGGRHEAPAAGG
jgi:exodeoxyribonuclease V alpha subunit